MMNDLPPQILINGYGKWIEELCIRYSVGTILFRESEGSDYINALLESTLTKNMLVGIYDKIKGVGKVFDRRVGIRREE